MIDLDSCVLANTAAAASPALSVSEEVGEADIRGTRGAAGTKRAMRCEGHA